MKNEHLQINFIFTCQKRSRSRPKNWLRFQVQNKFKSALAPAKKPRLRPAPQHCWLHTVSVPSPGRKVILFPPGPGWQGSAGSPTISPTCMRTSGPESGSSPLHFLPTVLRIRIHWNCDPGSAPSSMRIPIQGVKKRLERSFVVKSLFGKY